MQRVDPEALPAPPSEAAAPRWQDAGSLADLPADAGMEVRLGTHAVAVFQEAGRLYAVEATCPHQGGALAEGLVRDGVLTCPLHVWQFRLHDGVNLDQGPGLKTFPVRADGGRILIRI